MTSSPTRGCTPSAAQRAGVPRQPASPASRHDRRWHPARSCGPLWRSIRIGPNSTSGVARKRRSPATRLHRARRRRWSWIIRGRCARRRASPSRHACAQGDSPRTYRHALRPCVAAVEAVAAGGVAHADAAAVGAAACAAARGRDAGARAHHLLARAVALVSNAGGGDAVAPWRRVALPALRRLAPRLARRLADRVARAVARVARAAERGGVCGIEFVDRAADVDRRATRRRRQPARPLLCAARPL